MCIAINAMKYETLEVGLQTQLDALWPAFVAAGGDGLVLDNSAIRNLGRWLIRMLNNLWVLRVQLDLRSLLLYTDWLPELLDDPQYLVATVRASGQDVRTGPCVIFARGVQRYRVSVPMGAALFVNADGEQQALSMVYPARLHNLQAVVLKWGGAEGIEYQPSVRAASPLIYHISKRLDAYTGDQPTFAKLMLWADSHYWLWNEWLATDFGKLCREPARATPLCLDGNPGEQAQYFDDYILGCSSQSAAGYSVLDLLLSKTTDYPWRLRQTRRNPVRIPLGTTGTILKAGWAVGSNVGLPAIFFAMGAPVSIPTTIGCAAAGLIADLAFQDDQRKITHRALSVIKNANDYIHWTRLVMRGTAWAAKQAEFERTEQLFSNLGTAMDLVHHGRNTFSHAATIINNNNIYTNAVSVYKALVAAIPTAPTLPQGLVAASVTKLGLSGHKLVTKLPQIPQMAAVLSSLAKTAILSAVGYRRPYDGLTPVETIWVRLYSMLGIHLTIR